MATVAVTVGDQAWLTNSARNVNKDASRHGGGQPGLMSTTIVAMLAPWRIMRLTQSGSARTLHPACLHPPRTSADHMQPV